MSAAGQRHVTFLALMDHCSGRTDPAVDAHTGSCARCTAVATEARRIVEAGRRAAAAPRLTRRGLQRALAVFREAQTKRRPSLLGLVFDSLASPAPALRSHAPALNRFLRFEGEVAVEIEVSAAARGVDLRGQLTPPDFCAEVVVAAGKVSRRARVAPDGTFVLRAVPRRKIDLTLGTSRIAELDL